MLSGDPQFSGWHFSKRALGCLALVSFSAWAEPAVEIGIADYHFEPPSVQIKAGETVRWVNREKRTSHSVLFPEEGGLESERLFPEESWSRRFERPGRYPYRCGPHPEMQGVVHVE